MFFILEKKYIYIHIYIFALGNPRNLSFTVFSPDERAEIFSFSESADTSPFSFWTGCDVGPSQAKEEFGSSALCCGLGAPHHRLIPGENNCRGQYIIANDHSLWGRQGYDGFKGSI